MFSDRLIKIAKILNAKKFYYYVKLNNQITFQNAYSYPIYTTIKNNDDSYTLFKINNFNKILDNYYQSNERKENLISIINKDFDLNVNINLINNKDLLIKELEHHKKDFAINLSNINFKRLNKLRDNLYIESKKNYNTKQLATELNKKIELSFKDFELYFNTNVEFNNENINGFQKYDYHKWEIIANIKRINIDDITNILNEIEHKIGNKFNFLCYGRIEFVKNLTGVAADYDENQDSIRVSMKYSKEEIINYLIHELGHRLYDKFLNEEVKERIKSRYNFTKNKKLKAGDVLTLSNNKKYIFIKYYRNKLLCKSILDNQKYYIEFKYIIKINNINFINVPTVYSLTNEEEFFAELFSHYITNKLDKNLKDWLNKIL